MYSGYSGHVYSGHSDIVDTFPGTKYIYSIIFRSDIVANRWPKVAPISEVHCNTHVTQSSNVSRHAIERYNISTHVIQSYNISHMLHRDTIYHTCYTELQYITHVTQRYNISHMLHRDTIYLDMLHIATMYLDMLNRVTLYPDIIYGEAMCLDMP